MADVDADSYGLDMLKAGADLSDKTIAQLISLDAKEFQMGSYKVEIAQVNAVDVNDVCPVKLSWKRHLTKSLRIKVLTCSYSL